jgi:Replication factor A protein 3
MATPRISAAHLEKFNGSIVRIVGMVTKLGGTKANLIDNGHNVVLNLGPVSASSLALYKTDRRE